MKKNRSIFNKFLFLSRMDHAIRIVWHAGPVLTIVSFFLIIINGLFPLLTLYIIKLIVDSVTMAASAPDKNIAFKEVVLYISIGAAIGMLNIFFQLISGFIQQKQSLVVTDHVSDMIHSKSIEVDLEYYEDPKYFDTLHRAQKDGPYRPTRIVNGLIRLFQNGISLLGITFLLVTFHWSIAVVLFISVLPGLLIRIKFSNIIYKWQRKRTKKEREADYFHRILSRDMYAKEIRLFDFGHFFIEKFRNIRRSYTVSYQQRESHELSKFP